MMTCSCIYGSSSSRFILHCPKINFHSFRGEKEDKTNIQDYVEYMTELREYDVPYHVRFAIDNGTIIPLNYEEFFQSKKKLRGIQ